VNTHLNLPIEDVLTDVIDALEQVGAAVVLAPPGAGKTTRIPPAILDADLCPGERILVLQPRRVAARAAAQRVAKERGVPVGDEIGYAVRFERKASRATRIEFLTEGLLTRRLQADPFLEGIGCVIFDEFHERSLHADLGLAMVREIRRELRPDLKVVVMSATLTPGPVAHWLDAPIIESKGRAFPVDVTYAPTDDDRPIHIRCAAAIRSLAADITEGHILVFLPGVGEIERTASLLDGTLDRPILPLHGRLPAQAQDRALAPSTTPKVVLATNIAETSVTLAGVRAVVDTGLARRPVYDVAIGVARLETVFISRDSADQRAGRAGRTGPGRCHRMWTAHRHRVLPEVTPPEVTRVDLTGTLLEIRGWGSTPATFQWFESPKEAVIAQAEALLTALGAIDETGITAQGRTILALPTTPRLASVIIAGHSAGCLEEAATLAALAGEQDILLNAPDLRSDSDLDIRLEVLRKLDAGRRQSGVRMGAARRVQMARNQLIRVARKTLGEPKKISDPPNPVRCFLAGFPDRVAQRRTTGSERLLLADGAGARLAPESAARDAPLMIAVTLEGARRGVRAEHLVRLACAIDSEWLPIEEGYEVTFDSVREAIITRRTRRYRALVLASQPVADQDPIRTARALAEAVAKDPLNALRWRDDKGAAAYIGRIRWVAAARPDLGLDPLECLDTPGAVTPLIEGLCQGKRSFDGLRRGTLVRYLEGLLGYTVTKTLADYAPTSLTLPDGSTKAVTYTPGEPPVVATRFERLFGLPDTPKIAGVPVMLHLLAPNMRPVQITQDLASFWETGYPAVRKELRGRYPKHPWPDDPLTATPGLGRRRRTR